MPIVVPSKNVTRELARLLLDAPMQLFGPTAALSRVWGYTHPSDFEKQLDGWRIEITSSVNDHGARLEMLETRVFQSARLSEPALKLASYLCATSDVGMFEEWSYERLDEDGQIEDPKSFEEVAAELEQFEFIRVESGMGIPILAVYSTPKLYWAFDGVVVGYDTLADAREIAQLWLDDDENTATHRLNERLAWPLRRLNPALSYAVQFVGEGRTSGEISDEFSETDVCLIGEDKFRLRRFVEDGAQKRVA